MVEWTINGLTLATGSGGNVPNNNTETATFAGTDDNVNVDTTVTINQLIDEIAGGGESGTILSGSGNLIIDVNSTSHTAGISNLTGTSGADLLLDGNITISNTLSSSYSVGHTLISLANGANSITFGANSTLTLNTQSRHRKALVTRQIQL